MKAFVIVLLLVLGGWYAWSQGWIGGGETSATGNGETGGEEYPVDQQPSPATDDAGLSAQMAEQFGAAQQRWDEFAADGKNPAHHVEAPLLLRQFSEVLTATYNKPALKELQIQLVESRLTPLADDLFFSRRIVADDPTGTFDVHVVASGEELNSIGRDLGMSYQFLNLMRGKDAEDGSLKIGERLKVIHARDEGRGYFLHVDKSDFYMDLFINGLFARRYPVGIGADETPTPIGKARIDKRTKDQDWTHPITGEVIAWNDPANLLGRVWMRLDPNQLGQDGIGIHGYTGEGPAVGIRASNGCIRMRNEDAMQLYNILVPCDYYESGFISRAPMTVEIVR